MNRRLQDPETLKRNFNQLPEYIEEFLDYGTALSCAFNPFGTLLATGTDSGYVGIWDFETRGLAKYFSIDPAGDPTLSHVTSVCWSANGRHVLSGHSKPGKEGMSAADRAELQKSKDCIILWDVLTGKQLHEVTLQSGVTKVCLTPHKPLTAVVSLKAGPPVLVDLSQDKPAVTALDILDVTAVLDSGGASGSSKRGQTEAVGALALPSKSGRELYITQQQSSKAFLLVLDLHSKQLLDVVRLPAPVLSLSLNQQGSHLLLNCGKEVRLADVAKRPKSLKPLSRDKAEEKLKAAAADQEGSLLLGDGYELVSVLPVPTYSYKPPDGLSAQKESYVGAVCSADGEYVVAASASSALHLLRIFNTSGASCNVLTGPPKDGVVDLVWHPKRNMLVTVSTTGKVYIWAQVYHEEWSAFAPDFKELHTNMEYEEQEDEFDINPRDPAAPGQGAVEDAHPSRGKIDVVRRSAAEAREAPGSDDLVFLIAEVEPPATDKPSEKEASEQQHSSDDASGDEDGGPESSGRTGAGGAADSEGDQPSSRERPARRSKNVRFEQIDDDAFDDLMAMQEEYTRENKEKQKQPPPPGGRRRGRPPLNKRPPAEYRD